MQKIIIYKDKITLNQWESDKNDWVENDIKTLGGPITKHFSTYVLIKDDVTVEDFFNHLEYYEKDIDYCFSGYNNDVPLRLFLDEMRQEIEDDKKGDFSDVELIWQGEILNNTFCLFGHVLAFLSDKKIEEVGEDNNVPHDISLLPINCWKDCLFYANEVVLINNLGTVEELTDDLVFEGYHYWTLFDVISKFIAAISLNGTPEERNKLASQIVNKQYDVKEVAKNPDQANYWLTILESELEELKISSSNAIESEEYERAEVLKKDMESLESEIKILKEEVKKYKINK